MAAGKDRRTELMERVPASSALRSLMVLGDVWTLRILREAFRGTRRFGVWQETLGIAKPVLSNRLSRLVLGRVFSKKAASGTTGFKEYWLTEQGLDLWSVLIAIWSWETHWIRHSREQRLRLVHLTCGRQIIPVPACGHCGMSVDASSTEPRPGPGAGAQNRLPPAWLRRAEISARRKRGSAIGNETARILGDQCNSGIVAMAFRGTRRFTDFEQQLGVSPDTLSDRLKQMVEIGVLDRRQYQTSPDRHEYRLTEKGRTLFPITLELMRWGDRWLATKSGPPLIVVHKPCRHRLKLVFRCSACDGLLSRQDLRLDFANEGHSPPNAE
jgi:DNA-binding HxlR family transcriptional regulator